MSRWFGLAPCHDLIRQEVVYVLFDFTNLGLKVLVWCWWVAHRITENPPFSSVAGVPFVGKCKKSYFRQNRPCELESTRRAAHEIDTD